MGVVEQENVYTVAMLNRQVRTALERSYSGVWLEAEVGRASTPASGHVYFELTDPGGNASISAVMWRGSAQRYGNRIVQGALIRCFGKLTLYEAGGKYQFSAERVMEAGKGDKARALAELTKKLEAEGLFAPENKRPLPPFPSCVGIVTSRQGAALQDMIKVAGRRFPTRLLLAHAAVQGATAPAEIAQAVRLLGSRPEVEVLIVGRGGGGSDDLEAFNDELVVRAVAECQVPVVSAVGHEVDVSLCDLVADKRAATPSEAAELVVPDSVAVEKQLQNQRQRLLGQARIRVGEGRQRNSRLQGRLAARDPRVRLRKQLERFAVFQEFLSMWPGTATADARVRLNRMKERLVLWSRTAVTGHKGNLVAATHGVYSWPGAALEKAKGDLGRQAASLDALSPLASLGRGYAIVRDRNGRILKRGQDAVLGERVEVTLSEGGVGAEITEILSGRPGGGK